MKIDAHPKKVRKKGEGKKGGGNQKPKRVRKRCKDGSRRRRKERTKAVKKER